MTDARIAAAARHLFNARSGYTPDDTDGPDAWDELAYGQVRETCLAEAAALVAAIDAEDNRIRLTMPEFNAIRADAVQNLNSALHRHYDGADLDAIRATGVPDFIHVHAEALNARYIEPVNHEQAMASLVTERLAAAMLKTADFFDHASLPELTEHIDLDASVPPRFKRKMIQGCAEWLRTRAAELATGEFRPYRRIDTKATTDEDRYTALTGALHRTIERSEALAAQERDVPAFIMTEDLRTAVSAHLPAAAEDPRDA